MDVNYKTHKSEAWTKGYKYMKADLLDIFDGRTVYNSWLKISCIFGDLCHKLIHE